MTQKMSITDLRKNIFSVVEAAKINNQITEIMLHGEVIAEIRPKVEKKFDWDKWEKEMEEGIKYLREVGWKENKDFRKNFKFRKW